LQARLELKAREGSGLVTIEMFEDFLELGELLGSDSLASLLDDFLLDDRLLVVDGADELFVGSLDGGEGEVGVWVACDASIVDLLVELLEGRELRRSRDDVSLAAGEIAELVLEFTRARGVDGGGVGLDPRLELLGAVGELDAESLVGLLAAVFGSEGALSGIEVRLESVPLGNDIGQASRVGTLGFEFAGQAVEGVEVVGLGGDLGTNSIELLLELSNVGDGVSLDGVGEGFVGVVEERIEFLSSLGEADVQVLESQTSLVFGLLSSGASVEFLLFVEVRDEVLNGGIKLVVASLEHSQGVRSVLVVVHAKRLELRVQSSEASNVSSSRSSSLVEVLGGSDSLLGCSAEALESSSLVVDPADELLGGFGELLSLSLVDGLSLELGVVGLTTLGEGIVDLVLEVSDVGRGEVGVSVIRDTSGRKIGGGLVESRLVLAGSSASLAVVLVKLGLVSSDVFEGESEVVVVDGFDGIANEAREFLGLVGKADAKILLALFLGESSLEVVLVLSSEAGESGERFLDLGGSVVDGGGVVVVESVDLGLEGLESSKGGLLSSELGLEDLEELGLEASSIQGVDFLVSGDVGLLLSGPLFDFLGIGVESLDERGQLLLSGKFGRDGFFATLELGVQVAPDGVDGSEVETSWWNESGSVVLGKEGADGIEESFDVDSFDILGSVGGGLEASVLGGLVLGSSKSVVKVALLEGWDGIVGPGIEGGGTVSVLLLEFLLVVKSSDGVSHLIGELVAVALEDGEVVGGVLVVTNTESSQLVLERSEGSQLLLFGLSVVKSTTNGSNELSRLTSKSIDGCLPGSKGVNKLLSSLGELLSLGLKVSLTVELNLVGGSTSLELFEEMVVSVFNVLVGEWGISVFSNTELLELSPQVIKGGLLGVGVVGVLRIGGIEGVLEVLDGFESVSEVVILDVVGSFLVPGVVVLGLLGELETKLFDLLLSGELVLEVLSLGGLWSSEVGESLSESVASLLDFSSIRGREGGNLGSEVLNGLNARLAVGVLLIEGVVDLKLGLGFVEGVDGLVDTEVVLLGSEPTLELISLELESSSEVVKLLLSGELVAESLFSGIFRGAKVSPILVNASWGKFFWWNEWWAMLVSQLEGDVVEQSIQIDLFRGLWWLDGGLVVLELGNLLLGTSEGVVEVSVVQGLVG